MRTSDAPCTPAGRLRFSGAMLPPQREVLDRLNWETDLAELTRRILQLQRELIRLEEAKTQAQVS